MNSVYQLLREDGSVYSGVRASAEADEIVLPNPGPSQQVWLYQDGVQMHGPGIGVEFLGPYTDIRFYGLRSGRASTYLRARVDQPS